MLFQAIFLTAFEESCTNHAYEINGARFFSDQSVLEDILADKQTIFSAATRIP
jgi:hypothetical protein